MTADLPSCSNMCIRVTELYAGCRCVYYVHGIDACRQYGRHPVIERVVYVGLNCPRHTRRRDLTTIDDIDELQQPGTLFAGNKLSTSHSPEPRAPSRKSMNGTFVPCSRSAPSEMDTHIADKALKDRASEGVHHVKASDFASFH